MTPGKRCINNWVKLSPYSRTGHLIYSDIFVLIMGRIRCKGTVEIKHRKIARPTFYNPAFKTMN